MRHNLLTVLRRCAVPAVALIGALLVWLVPGSTASTARRSAGTKDLVVSLALPHQAALNTYLARAYDRADADYHHFLTPAAFRARFGASHADILSAQARLRALGLSSTAAPSGLYLTVPAPSKRSAVARDLARRADRAGSPLSTATFADSVRGALGSQAESVITPSEMPTLTPEIELPSRSGARRLQAAAMRGAHAITGVDGGATACLSAGESGAYTAPQLASAYNFNAMYAAGYHGEGMSAAVVEYGAYHPSNVTAFDRCYGIDTPVIEDDVDGGAGAAPNSSEAEVTLDIDTVNEMDPDLADMYVIEAPDTGPGELDAYDAFVTQDKAQVLSVSWGECEESSSQSYERLLGAITEEAAAQGQQIFVAAGDSGSTECKGSPLPTGKSISSDSEAALPWVTGVGGTDLSQASAQPGATVHREAVWNDGLGAGGGGESVTWAMPSWQKSYLTASGDTPVGMSDDCGAPAGQDCRMEPDISMNADAEEGGADPSVWGVPKGPTPAQFRTQDDKGSPGYSVYCNSPGCTDGTGLGWEPIGGTSAATPLAASAAILFDQEARQSGVALGALNPALYQVASDATDYAKDFYDITGGSNDDQYTALACLGGCHSTLYPAGTGYDMATGLGSMNVGNLAGDLMASAGAVTLTPDTEQMYGDTGNGPNTTARVSIDDVTTAATQNGYTATSNASWLVLDQTSGRTPSTLRWHVDPHGLKAGAYQGEITVTAANGSTATLTVSYTVTAPARLALTTTSLHFYERQVKAAKQKVEQVCDNPLWGDELEFDGTIPAADGLSTPGDEASGTRRTLRFVNRGAAGSVLHYSVSEIDLNWVGNDADPNHDPAGFQEKPGQPLVPSEGALGAGDTAGIKLASFANANTVGGYPALQQGTYRGSLVIRDLADPADHVTVPVTLTLGDGAGTPRLGVTRSAIRLTVAPGHSQTIDFGLTNRGGACGYGYTISSDASWLSTDAARRSGRVTAHATLGTPLRVTVPASMAAGVYHATVQIASMNAATDLLSVPVTLTVS